VGICASAPRRVGHGRGRSSGTASRHPRLRAATNGIQAKTAAPAPDTPTDFRDTRPILAPPCVIRCHRPRPICYARRQRQLAPTGPRRLPSSCAAFAPPRSSRSAARSPLSVADHGNVFKDAGAQIRSGRRASAPAPAPSSAEPSSWPRLPRQNPSAEQTSRGAFDQGAWSALNVAWRHHGIHFGRQTTGTAPRRRGRLPPRAG